MGSEQQSWLTRSDSIRYAPFQHIEEGVYLLLLTPFLSADIRSSQYNRVDVDKHLA
jgi:hypothetical protein